MQVLIKSSVGKKMLMAITGQFMILFVIVHLLGNISLYFGWINTYAKHLHDLWPLVWIVRLVMITLLSLHVVFGIQLTLENRSARPDAYALKKSLRATFASKNMIWTGLIIAGFLIYHLLHFTVQVIHPEMSAKVNADAMGLPDIFSMVVFGFQNLFILLLYIASMIALTLHLVHGIQSSFQTVGLNTDQTLPVIVKAGTIASLILFIGYASIPVVIFIGIVKG
jgi:succinate dehydrogenase / fumarate reductase cytochrome b subunit